MSALDLIAAAEASESLLTAERLEREAHECDRLAEAAQKAGDESQVVSLRMRADESRSRAENLRRSVRAVSRPHNPAALRSPAAKG